MTYEIRISRRAQRALAAFPKSEFRRLRDAIHNLSSEPRPTGCKKLIGREGWRLRVGQYRIIYEIGDVLRIITILDVGHRREVYR